MVMEFSKMDGEEVELDRWGLSRVMEIQIIQESHFSFKNYVVKIVNRFHTLFAL